ncbi:G-type lectin S-receptor-like serine/threonine-protein kinase [Vitis vinifera]|uniref:non-specific serine/threonine protein kinase n=1 Tax=Vitis vinifera TaxID=29760 RepID=A0A438G915_VITVI|nr:G-type lectin S-receptor-like serine/threonine-protein kinase [Vitis vinifera]
MVLNWPKRFLIINGIVRGLLYLHQDFILRIIHRDLKTNNILLDSEMNQKFSDFGIAKSFGGNEIEANTNTVVGTYGYMSPENAIAGLYSTKSDIYSFDVLVLEIVSGKRNRGFYHLSSHINLLGHAWTLYMEGRSLELIDASMGGTCNRSEVLRSIHGALPQPKEPGFFSERHVLEVNSNPENTLFSSNEDNGTILEGGKRNVQGDYISIYGVREGIGNGETITSGGGSFELGSLA